jgi:hypothetical protein
VLGLSSLLLLLRRGKGEGVGAAWMPYVNSGRANLRTFTLIFS